MGFFRKAKVKHRPQSDLIIGNMMCIDESKKSDVEETSSKSNRSYRDVKIYETFSTKHERRQVKDESVGETLDPRDHFDLFIPIKSREKKGGKGSLLPSGRSFSKRQSADGSSTVSSISYDSMLLSEDKSHKQETNTISMRSIKSKLSRRPQSRQATIKHDNARKDQSVSKTGSNKSMDAVRNNQEHSGCCLWVHEPSKQQDAETRVPEESQKKSSNTVRGIKSPTTKTAAHSTMNSTIPTIPSQEDLGAEDAKNVKGTESREPANESKAINGQNSNNNFLLSWFCGPRQLLPEDLVADDVTAPLQYSEPEEGQGTDEKVSQLQFLNLDGTFRTYEKPLQVKKKQSLFDPDSHEETEEEVAQTIITFDEEENHPTILDEAQTTIAHAKSEDFSRGAEPKDESQLYEHEMYENNEWDNGKQGNKPWKLRIPRNLPKVRSFTRSLSRGRSFLSTNRSQRSVRSKSSRSRSGRSQSSKSRRSRNRSRSKHRSSRRRDATSGRGRLRRHAAEAQHRSRSRGRRPSSSTKRHDSTRHEQSPSDYLDVEKRGRRHHR